MNRRWFLSGIIGTLAAMLIPFRRKESTIDRRIAWVKQEVESELVRGTRPEYRGCRPQCQVFIEPGRPDRVVILVAYQTTHGYSSGVSVSELIMPVSLLSVESESYRQNMVRMAVSEMDSFEFLSAIERPAKTAVTITQRCGNAFAVYRNKLHAFKPFVVRQSRTA